MSFLYKCEPRKPYNTRECHESENKFLLVLAIIVDLTHKMEEARLVLSCGRRVVRLCSIRVRGGENSGGIRTTIVVCCP